jgi:hypothetical protein
MSPRLMVNYPLLSRQCVSDLLPSNDPFVAIGYSGNMITEPLLSKGLFHHNNLMFCLSSRRRFMLCLACVPYHGAGTGVRRWGVALSTGPN